MPVDKYRKIISAITIKGLYTPDVPPPRLQIICMEKKYFKLLIGRRYFHAECEYHAAKKFKKGKPSIFQMIFFPPNFHNKGNNQ